MKRNTEIILNENNQYLNRKEHVNRKNRTFVHSQQLNLSQSRPINNRNQYAIAYQARTVVNILIFELMDQFQKVLLEKERRQIIQNAVESCDRLFHTENWQFHPTSPSVIRNQYEPILQDQQPQKKQPPPMLGFDKIIRQKKMEKTITLENCKKANNGVMKKHSSKLYSNSLRSNRGSILSTLSRRTQSKELSSPFLSKLVPLNLNTDHHIQMNQTRRIQDILRDKKNNLQLNNNLKGRVFFTTLDQKDSVNLSGTLRQTQKFSELNKSSRGYVINSNILTSTKLAQLRSNVHTSRQQYNYDQNGDTLPIKKRQNNIKNMMKVVKTTYNILKDNESQRTNIKRAPKRQILNVKLKPVKKISSARHNQIPLSDLKNFPAEDELKSDLLSHFLKQRARFRQLDQNSSQTVYQ